MIDARVPFFCAPFALAGCASVNTAPLPQRDRVVVAGDAVTIRSHEEIPIIATTVKSKPNKVLPVPREVEEYVSTAKLASMGIAIDTLTADQKKYGESWEHGT